MKHNWRLCLSLWIYFVPQNHCLSTFSILQGISTWGAMYCIIFDWLRCEVKTYFLFLRALFLWMCLCNFWKRYLIDQNWKVSEETSLIVLVTDTCKTCWKQRAMTVLIKSWRNERNYILSYFWRNMVFCRMKTPWTLSKSHNYSCILITKNKGTLFN